jgi:hypothetical protein
MRGRLLPWAAIAFAALVYPLAVIVGGLPRFPSRAECIHRAQNGQPIEAVFGRYSRDVAAGSALNQVLAAGFKGAQIEPDGCGLLKIDVKGVPNLAVGQSLVREAQQVGLHATLERVVS